MVVDCRMRELMQYSFPSFDIIYKLNKFIEMEIKDLGDDLE